MATIEERIRALEEKLRQEKAKKQKMEARKKSEAAKIDRGRDTRRKVLVGALILGRVDRGEWPREKLMAMLDDSLERADERALFGLPIKLSAGQIAELKKAISDPEADLLTPAMPDWYLRLSDDARAQAMAQTTGGGSDGH
jgi:hypothetical protein